MQRLVYTPRVDAYIKADSGIYDISDYIVRGNVARKLDQISTVNLTIRNPKKMFTDHVSKTLDGKTVRGPMFHPQDPIVVGMTRLKDYPVQVFTGYLDETPYLQLHPGEVTLRASCTLKRLLYTYFDAGLPFFHEWLASHGWSANEQFGGIANVDVEAKLLKGNKGQLTDAGFGALLFDSLTDIGNWPEDAIHIENLPHDLVKIVSHLYDENQKDASEAGKQVQDLIHNIIGTANLSPDQSGTGSPSSTSGGPGTHPIDGTLLGAGAFTAFCYALAKLTGLSLRVLGAWCLYENGPPDNPLNIGPGNHYGSVDAGAHATADLLKSDDGSLGYKAILHAAKVGTDQDQMEAIAASSWCPGCDGYLQTLEGVYNSRVHVRPKGS